MTRLHMRAALIFVLLSWKACSLRDINDVSIIEDGVIRVLLSVKKCDFQIKAVALSGGQSFLPRTLRIRECTTIVVISNLGGEGVLIQVPNGEGNTEVIYSLIKKPANGSAKDISRDGVDEAVELYTPLVSVPGGDLMHPAMMYISKEYSWPTRRWFCNDERIQPRSCGSVYCNVSTCVTVTLSDPVFLYVAYVEEVCNENSRSVICAAICTHFHDIGWYRQYLARQCVVTVVADTEQCNSLYNATENSTVCCNFATGLCRRSSDQRKPDVPGRPTRPSLYKRSYESLTLLFSVELGFARINYYLLKIINVTDANYSNQTNITGLSSTLVNITSGDPSNLTEEKPILEGKKEEVVGYEVRLKVRGLEQGQEYVFAVAAGSAIGVGDFSDPSDPYSLESGVTTPPNNSSSSKVLSVTSVVLLATVVLMFI